MSSAQTKKIMTVLGPVNPDQLGYTYMHEHLIYDCSFSGNDPEKKFDEEDILIREMKDLARAGAQTLVDCTCIGLAPEPEVLKRIAKAAGINIIASTGFYRYIVYPDYIAASTVDQLAAQLISDCEKGFGDTGIRPGMLAEFASHDPKQPNATGHNCVEPPNEIIEKVFRAAARTQAATGLPITTHTPRGEGAEWEIAIFAEEKADLSKVVIGHVGLSKPKNDKLRWILDQGVNIGIDGIAYDERDNFDFLATHKAQLVKTVIDSGHIDQITISLDTARKYHLKKYGGHGFAFLMAEFIPLLRLTGITDKQIDHILIENPKRILTPTV